MREKWVVPSFEGKSYAYAREQAVLWQGRANQRLRRCDRNYRWWKVAIIIYWMWVLGLLFPSHVWAAFQSPEPLSSALQAAWMLVLATLVYFFGWRSNEKSHKRSVKQWMGFISEFEEIITLIDSHIAKYGDDALYGE